MAHAFALGPRCPLLLSIVMTTAAACGGSGGGLPTQPTARVSLQVTASPSPVALAVCPPASCDASTPPQFEVVTTLAVRETGGVAGRVDSLGITLRRNSDNVTVLTTTLAPASVQVRFAANGTVSVPVAFHHAQDEVTAPTTATLVVNATGDTGGTVSATVTLPVNGPPTRSGLFITGNYQIAQAAVTTTCGDTGTPATVTGWVTLTGPDAFQLRDTGGTTFTGTVQDDGRFVANAVFGPDAGGQTYTQRLEGTFGASGFTGVLSVTVQPRACAFTRNWTATRLP
jgi:hypothetical protein